MPDGGGVVARFVTISNPKVAIERKLSIIIVGRQRLVYRGPSYE